MSELYLFVLLSARELNPIQSSKAVTLSISVIVALERTWKINHTDVGCVQQGYAWRSETGLAISFMQPVISFRVSHLGGLPGY